MPTRDKTQIKGCFHIHIENGEIKNVFSHMDGFPDNCVIHMLPEKVFSYEEFIESHPFDKDEINVPYQNKIHNLKGLSVVITEDGSVAEEMVFDVEAEMIKNMREDDGK